jgi:hypothetical protein
MPADQYLRPQSDTPLAQKQNNIASLMFQLQAAIVELKTIEDQIASGGAWASLASYMGYTGENAATNAEAAYNLLGSVKTASIDGAFYQQFLGRMGG